MNREYGRWLSVYGWYVLLGFLASTGAAAFAQGGSASVHGSKRMAFEVVSIKPSWRNYFGFAPQAETTATQPDGYRAIDQSMIATITFAYLPLSYSWTNESKPLNQPKWLGDEYDIDARVAPADMAAWQKQGPGKEMLSAMLRSMLEERCKIAVHWVPGQTAGYALVVGKHGPKMRKSTPGEAIPPDSFPVRVGNVFYPDARHVARGKGDSRTDYPYYNISMEAMAGVLSTMFEVPVVDQTGLSGNYDLVLNKRQPVEGGAGPDPGDESSKWDLEADGLKLVPMKVATRRLVIDHIEKPSAN
ncbi:MAG TPA: TIGR03435 family protein [Acidobacteriaceae bacterium]|nr:TIGR03435 family protein [Acidobacteriaceae bacterium]